MTVPENSRCHGSHQQKEAADMDKRKREAALPIDSDMFFNVFPFHIVFSVNMQVSPHRV